MLLMLLMCSLMCLLTLRLILVLLNLPLTSFNEVTTLPSSWTALSQAFASNWFRWRISDERPGVNLVPRAHVPFGQHQDRVLVLTKRHMGSGNEIEVSWCWPKGTWALGTRLARSSLDNNIVRMRLDQQPIVCWFWLNFGIILTCIGINWHVLQLVAEATNFIKFRFLTGCDL